MASKSPGIHRLQRVHVREPLRDRHVYPPAARARPVEAVVAHVVFPAIGAVVDVHLLLQLDGKSQAARGTWLTCGVLYLTYLTRGFRRPPPEIEFVED